MNERAEQLKARSKRFAVEIVQLFQNLPSTTEAATLGKQLLRSATSVAANYRAACRGRSKAEFIAKIGTVVEEADETVLWLEMLADCKVVAAPRIAPLLREANELLAIFAASQLTARGRAGE